MSKHSDRKCGYSNKMLQTYLFKPPKNSLDGQAGSLDHRTEYLDTHKTKLPDKWTVKLRHTD